MDTQSSESSGLQFDKAEYGAGAVTGLEMRRCEDCSRPLADSYYTVDGRVTCFDCSDKAATGAPTQDLRGLPLAVVFGIGAAALGSLVYLLILKFTGYEIGLISIAVGWLVGKWMMKGSKGRGGLAYQLLAVVLTYHSIIFSYVVVGVWTMIENPAAMEGEAVAGGAPGQSAPTNPAGDPAVAPAASTPSAEVAPGSTAATAVPVDANAAAEEPITLGTIGVALVLIYLQALIIPFASGFENILGIAIILFGLWEAFRLTRLQVPAVSGPFQFGQGPQTIPPPDPEATSL